jgi:hypothetical protein
MNYYTQTGMLLTLATKAANSFEWVLYIPTTRIFLLLCAKGREHDDDDDNDGERNCINFNTISDESVRGEKIYMIQL